MEIYRQDHCLIFLMSTLLLDPLPAALLRPSSEIARNEALLRAQLEQYAASALRSYLEVENALDAESRLEEREAALRVALDEAKKAEERLSVRYSEGLATILQLLDAQSRAINAQSALISARKERLANRVRLYLALGGGRFGELPEDLSGSEEGLVLAQVR
jgi:outer membrane protein TolC